MNAKDLIQLYDQTLAFNAIMSGALQAEIEAAKSALAALGDAQEIATARASLEADKTALESYKATVNLVIQESKDELKEKQTALEDKEASIVASEKALAIETAALQEEDKIFKAEMAKAYADLDKVKASIQPSLDDIAEKQIAIKKAQEDLIAREQALAAKIAALKAIG